MIQDTVTPGTVQKILRNSKFMPSMEKDETVAYFHLRMLSEYKDGALSLSLMHVLGLDIPHLDILQNIMFACNSAMCAAAQLVSDASRSLLVITRRRLPSTSSSVTWAMSHHCRGGGRRHRRHGLQL